MPESTAPHLILFAAYCYRALLCFPASETASSDEVAAIRDTIGGNLNTEDLMQLSRSIYQTAAQSGRRDRIISRWKPRMEPSCQLTEQESGELLDDLFSNGQHPLDCHWVFGNRLIINKINVEQGDFSDKAASITGNMPCWTLHLSLNGEGLLSNSRIEKALTVGDIVLYHPDAHYCTSRHPQASHWEHIWVLFQPPARWRQWMIWDNLDEGIQHIHLSDKTQLPVARDLLEKIMYLKESKTPYLPELQHNLLEEFFIHVAGFKHLQASSAQDDRVNAACDFIDENYNRSININDIAAACNLSPSRLSHLFKDHMGMGPKAWLNNVRIQQARRLLNSSNFRISQIAALVGFEDPIQFAKNFKKNVGCTPKDFRRNFDRREAKAM